MAGNGHARETLYHDPDMNGRMGKLGGEPGGDSGDSREVDEARGACGIKQRAARQIARAATKTGHHGRASGSTLPENTCESESCGARGSDSGQRCGEEARGSLCTVEMWATWASSSPRVNPTDWAAAVQLVSVLLACHVSSTGSFPADTAQLEQLLSVIDGGAYTEQGWDTR